MAISLPTRLPHRARAGREQRRTEAACRSARRHCHTKFSPLPAILWRGPSSRSQTGDIGERLQSVAPRRAAELIEQAGIGDPANLLIGSSSIGLVKGYARMINTQNADGTHTGVRDSRIPRDLWRRIADAEMGDQIRSSFTVSLAAGSVDPAVAISGIRFDDKSLRAVIVQHGAVARPIEQTRPPRPTLSALPEGKVLVTVTKR